MTRTQILRTQECSLRKRREKSSNALTRTESTMPRFTYFCFKPLLEHVHQLLPQKGKNQEGLVMPSQGKASLFKGTLPKLLPSKVLPGKNAKFDLVEEKGEKGLR